MKWITHISIGVGFTTLILHITKGLEVNELIIVMLLSIIGSILPDLYHPHLRRNLFLHSLIGCFVVSFLTSLGIGLTYYTLYEVDYRVIVDTTFKPIFTSYLLHLICDSMTAGGISPSYPITRRKFRLLHLRYDDPVLNSVGVGIGLITLIFTIIMMGFEGKWVIPR